VTRRIDDAGHERWHHELGKRTTSIHVQRAAPAPAEAATPKSEGGSMLSGVLGGVVIGLALIAGGAILLSLWSGSSAPGRPGAASAVDPQLATLCQRPADRLKIAVRRDDSHERKTEILLAEVGHVHEMERYVTCAVRNARERLCNSTERAALAREINAYLSLRRATSSAVAASMGLSRGALEALYADSVAKEGGRDAVLAKMGTMAVPPGFRELHSIMTVSPEMITGLRGLIEDGYMGAGDLAGFMGMFLPSALEPHLVGIKTAGNACR
jgi:hypothetical protein